MYTKTYSVEDTDKFMSLIYAFNAVTQIKKILNNKHSHAHQIKQIKKLLEGFK